MKSLRELNAKIDRTPLELAGITVRPGYAVGRLGTRHACSKLHIVYLHEVIASDDPEAPVGGIAGYALCDSTREAAVMAKADLKDLGCEKCRDSLRRLLAEKRRVARRRTA